MQSGTLLLIVVIIGGLLVLGCLFGAFRNLSRKRLLNDNPTSKTQGVFIGLAEVKGTAESESPLVSYLAGIQCVQYTFQIDEHWSRTVHETYTDSKGRAHTRTKTESGWTNVAKDSKSSPFYIKDDTGVLRILPEGASLEAKEVFERTCGRKDPIYYGKGPEKQVANSDYRRRFRETAIPLHATLYIVGQAREREDIVAAEIARDKNAPMFLISTRTEKQVSTRLGIMLWVWSILGLILALGTALAWNLIHSSSQATSFLPYIIAFFGFLLAAGIGWLWTVYNGFINLHHRVQQGWSQIDVQLKRRADLIPNLVEVVRGYRDYEQDTQTLITEMRSQLTATPPGTTGPDSKGIAARLIASIERYPELKANESFLRLQKSLVETEQRIALARDYYNEIATFYNNRLEIVPDRYVSALARLRPRQLMSAMDFERAPVTVKLAE
jgi:hypothetical protein